MCTIDILVRGALYCVGILKVKKKESIEIHQHIMYYPVHVYIHTLNKRTFLYNNLFESARALEGKV